MCRLEEVACEFSGVGCEDRFLRENEEEHIHQKSQSQPAAPVQSTRTTG